MSSKIKIVKVRQFYIRHHISKPKRGLHESKKNSNTTENTTNCIYTIRLEQMEKTASLVIPWSTSNFAFKARAFQTFHPRKLRDRTRFHQSRRK